MATPQTMYGRTTIGPGTQNTNTPPASHSGYGYNPSLSSSALQNGIDEGPPMTSTGRLKRRRDDEVVDLEDPDDAQSNSTKVIKTYREASVADFPFKQRSYHIRRAFDLFCSIHTVVNDGLKRQAKMSESASDCDLQHIQSDRDFQTYTLIMEHLVGLDQEILRLRNSPIEFRFLLRKIKTCADNARNNDTAGLKKDVMLFLTENETAPLKIFKPDQYASSKHDRGFFSDITGKFLCPVSMDWEDHTVRDRIRNGEVQISAADFPRLLYKNCKYSDADPENGFGENRVLVRVVKYVLTGRSSAFSDTSGGKTTRAGNAEIAGTKCITPRIIAYGACMLRFALSTQESWNRMDGEFDLEEFYWNIVEIFEGSGTFGENLLAWWNKEVFGRSVCKSNAARSKAATSTLDRFKAHREARLQATLTDRTRSNRIPTASGSMSCGDSAN